MTLCISTVSVVMSPLSFFCFCFFLAALGLHCCTRALSSCGERGLLFVVVCGSSFIFDFIYLSLLFYLVSLTKGFPIFFIFSKNPLLVSLVLSFFSGLYFIYFLYDLYYFLPSANFGLNLFFFYCYKM